MTQGPAVSHDPATYLPPAKYTRSGDGARCCPHAKPVGPGSCEHCWELHRDSCARCRERHLTAITTDLHARRVHPDWEYATTEGPRKQWDDADTPPYGADGEPDHSWERNVDAGRDGWERFDYTEESYWRRRKPPATQPEPAAPRWHFTAAPLTAEAEAVAYARIAQHEQESAAAAEFIARHSSPAVEQLLNLADRGERHGLTADEAQRLRDGINAMEQLHQAHLNVEARLARDELAANRRAKQAEAERDTARATAQRLNRRAQTAESETATYRRAVAQWDVSERGTYIPQSSLVAIGRAAGTDVLGSVRHLRHFERVEQAEAALAALHEGEQPRDDELTVPTPAQWIWRWNRATPAERLAAASNVLANAEAASRCVLENHPARAEQLRQDLTRKEQELATWRATVTALDSGAPGTPRHRAEEAEAAIERVREFADDIDTPTWRAPGTEVAARLRSALDPQEPQPEAAVEEQPLLDEDGRPICTCTHGKHCHACRDDIDPQPGASTKEI